MALSVSEISQVGIGFLALFAGFPQKIAPPEGSSRLWTGFASVIAGGAFVTVKVLSNISASPGSVKFWGTVALCSILISIVLCFSYISARQTYTVEYAGGPRIAGTEREYTADAQAYLKARTSLTRAQVLFDFAGNTEQVWTPKSLKRARLILGGLYSLFVGCLAFGLYLAVEIVQLAPAGSIDVHVNPPTPVSSQGSGLIGFLADTAADAVRTAQSSVNDAAKLPVVASQEFVKGLSGEAGKKLVDGFAYLIASGFKPSSDKNRDSQIIRTFFVREIVRTIEQGGLPLMEERIFFGIGQASLTREAYAKIGRIRDFVAANPSSIILLKGNADTLGSARSNETLARKRSARVRAALVSAGGIASNRVFTTNLGNDSLPTVTPPNTPEEQNRSVSVEVRNWFP